MTASSLTKLRIYLHLVPVFGTVLSLWTLYGESTSSLEDIGQPARQRRAASKLSVVLGLGCGSAIALLATGAAAQASQIAHLRFLLASSFIGSGYFLVSLALMFQVAQNQSLHLPGVSAFSRRLP
ncbi:MAG: hypothetical protein AAFU53_10640 [Cyanobacteria bacterium J06632_3]